MISKQTAASRRIRRYIASHPNSPSSSIAKLFEVSVKKIYQMRSYDKRKAATKEAGKVWDGKSVLKRIFVLPDSVEREEAIKEVMLHDPTSDPVNNPAHYTAGGAETIDFIEAKKLCYHLGNVVKYVTRAEHKGSRLEDLQKARWYLDREIMRITVGL